MNPHIDQGGKTHRNSPQEQGICGIADHNAPYFRIEGVPQNRDGEGGGEEDGIQGEEDDGEIVQPARLIWDGNQKDADDAGTHRSRKPPRAMLSWLNRRS